MFGFALPVLIVLVVLFIVFVVIMRSIRYIEQTEVGLVTKRFSRKKLTGDNPIAFNGEAGYQADLLMPGLRWKFWPIYTVRKYPWVQVPAGQIGVVIAQVGKPLPIGAKSAEYKKTFGNYTDLRNFINDGQKGVQRPVLPPGTLAPIHPIGFIVITRDVIYGEPVDPDLLRLAQQTRTGRLTAASFGLTPQQLEVTRIEPQPVGKDGKLVDMVGIVTIFEGQPLLPGDIACRLKGFEDIKTLEAKEGTSDSDLVEALLSSQNDTHNNYQDFQEFLDKGGRIGLQHDPLLYGAYNLNPFLIKVDSVPMLVVEQGEVAVIKSYVGLPTKDTSGAEFKFGSLVRPGHRGVWQEPLRTGKYAINPRIYEAEIVPTAILTLNWAEQVSMAHQLDRNLKQITAKSKEGFVFNIDLQVQIHVPDTKAPKVISMVGTMQNLVNEVLQAAVGNHFRDKLQSMPAVTFIETRQKVQEEAFKHISDHLKQYEVETRGVYIQDVILPEQLVKVLTQREIANQEIETFRKQTLAQDERIKMENSKGTADMQSLLAESKVNVDIQTNYADARKKTGEGDASYTRQTGEAQGASYESIGLARAKGYDAQVKALGPVGATLVNAVIALAEGKTRLVPDVLVAGGNGTGSLDGLMGVLTRMFNVKLTPPAAPITDSVSKPDTAAATPASETSEASMASADKPELMKPEQSETEIKSQKKDKR